MPTPEEQVAQIEASFRRRFFGIIPKIVTQERLSWTEEQHALDRLSRSLAAYVIVGLAGIDDASAAGAVTDGRNDHGIDALYFDRSDAQLIVVQSKFKRTGAAHSQEEVQKVISGVKALLARRFDEFNASFRQRLDEIEEALDTPGVTLQINLACLGDTLGPHATQELNALQAELNAVRDSVTWKICGRTKIAEWLIAEQDCPSISVDIVLENWAKVTAPRKAIYGQMAVATLAQLVEEHGNKLFERNIRHYLGSVSVNSAIAETARRKPQEFFYLNNGLTAVAEQIIPAQGTPEKCKFRLENVSIVNGAQTAGSVATARIVGELSPDAKVLLTVIEIGQQPDDIGLRITRARNYQNVVRGVDFAALDPNQERLRQELAVIGITYHYRPSSEARARRDDAFTLEEAAVALASLSQGVLSSEEVRALKTQGRNVVNAIDFVVMAKKEVGRLWEQESAAYATLFPAGLSGIRVYRLVRMYRLIDQILADTECAEDKYARRMFFRHGRYFIMAFIAHQSPRIGLRHQVGLSDEDKTMISVQTNELAELIYSQSQVLTKGYLAIFRNLTDSQPLADGILDRLKQQSEAAAVPRAGRNLLEPQGPE